MPLPATTIAHTLRHIQARGLDRLDAQLLVLHALGRGLGERAWLVAHDDDLLSPPAANALEASTARRVAGEPLAYITGHKEFFGLDLLVDARVLVPRPDTETLVEWALNVLPTHAPASVIDLGTGSGAIALALKATRPTLLVHALDYSTDALVVAHSNAQRLGLDVQFSHGSWLNGITAQFDAIVSNPPYIEAGDHHLSALTAEPLQALSSGVDGLDAIRQIIMQAPSRLRPGGWLLLEHGFDQAAVVCALLTQAGFEAVQSRNDLAGIARCSGGRLAGS
jgi:release factor glutamine methyltransferase